MKREWSYLGGNVCVKVRARDAETERFIGFEFTCIISENLDAYDRLDILDDVAHDMAKLRNCHRAEIIDVREIEE